MSSQQEERLFDLLEKRTFDGLTPAEERELTELNGDADVSLDLTAAALSLGELDEIEPMPAHIRAKIEDDADEWFARGKTTVLHPVRPEAERITASSSSWNWLGWAVAAAACHGRCRRRRRRENARAARKTDPSGDRCRTG